MTPRGLSYLSASRHRSSSSYENRSSWTDPSAGMTNRIRHSPSMPKCFRNSLGSVTCSFRGDGSFNGHRRIVRGLRQSATCSHRAYLIWLSSLSGHEKAISGIVISSRFAHGRKAIDRSGSIFIRPTTRKASFGWPFALSARTPCPKVLFFLLSSRLPNGPPRLKRRRLETPCCASSIRDAHASSSRKVLQTPGDDLREHCSLCEEPNCAESLRHTHHGYIVQAPRPLCIIATVYGSTLRGGLRIVGNSRLTRSYELVRSSMSDSAIWRDLRTSKPHERL